VGGCFLRAGSIGKKEWRRPPRVHVDQFRPRGCGLKAKKAGPSAASPADANFGSNGKLKAKRYFLYSN
jgi:hypothetical protein